MMLTMIHFPVSSMTAELLIGSITSRCSGNEPALLSRRHGWTREDSFVSLNESDNRPQIFVGYKLSRPFGLLVSS